MGRGNASSGIVFIVLAVLGVSWIITGTAGTYTHWPFVLLGLVVGLWAAQALNQ